MHLQTTIMLEQQPLTEQEKQYLLDVADYYNQVTKDPQKVCRQHPKPESYGISAARARELIARD